MSDRNAKLSIIIPIYNAEEYLEKCLNSILMQNEASACEIILVDDCSLDNSLEICKKYESSYTNIKLIINEENSGPGVARNRGIECAKGDYIYFVDADDLLEENALRLILEKIEEHWDYIFVNHLYMDEDGSFIDETVKSNFIKTTMEEFVKETFRRAIRYPGWKFVVRRDFIIKNNIVFSQSYLEEDVLFTWKLITLGTSAGFVEKPIYFYRINQNHSLMGRVAQDPIKAVQHLRMIAEDAVEFAKYLLKTNAFIEEQQIHFKTYFLSYLQVLLCVEDEEKLLEQDSEIINEGINHLKLPESELIKNICDEGILRGVQAFKTELLKKIKGAVSENKKIYIMPYSVNVKNWEKLIELYTGVEAIVIDNNLGKLSNEIKTLKEIEHETDVFIIVCHIKENVMLSIKKQLETIGKKESEDFILIR